MRVLATVTGSQGHARAMLPVLCARVDAGHEALVTPPAHLTQVFEHSDARVEPVMPDHRMEADFASRPHSIR
ncbi:hypothetical protein AB0E67_35155 [Streptomyces sp. NPDC032161]|uniref:hypothetical protein n=1 Tax=unclassified Streptomyces TaxID=2593676 RepID=UPI0033D6E0F0